MPISVFGHSSKFGSKCQSQLCINEAIIAHQCQGFRHGTLLVLTAYETLVRSNNNFSDLEFLTPDLWWLCMCKHFGYDTRNKTDAQISKYMQKLLINNRLILDKYFATRVHIFVAQIQKKFKIKDY